MTGTSFAAPRRPVGWPAGVLGMIALVVATEGYIGRRDTDLNSMYAIEWKMTGRAIRKEAAACQVLCFGTSLTKLGVSPRVLEERLGMPSYNFALSGCQPYAAYTALRRALRSGARPKAVVVDFKWSAIATGHTWNERVLPEMATLPECAELAVAARDATFFARMALVWGLPSYRVRKEIRENIMAAVRGEEPTRNWERAIATRNARANRGATHTAKGNYQGELKLDDPNQFPADWRCDPINEAYIGRFFALAAEHGIEAFWLVPPISRTTLARREAIGAEGQYTRFVESVSARHPGVTVIDARGSHYAFEAFFDSTHLNRDGAAALSADLADAIAARLAGRKGDGPRWVRLPDYRPDLRADRVEDMSATLARIAAENRERKQRRR